MKKISKLSLTRETLICLGIDWATSAQSTTYAPSDLPTCYCPWQPGPQTIYSYDRCPVDNDDYSHRLGCPL